MVLFFREGGAHGPAVITTTDTTRFTTHLHTVPHGPRCSKNGARLPLRLPSPSLPPGKSEDFCNMKSTRFQTLGTNKKVIIVHPQTRYYSPVERTLKLFLNFFLQEKIQTQETDVLLYQFPFSCSFEVDFANFFGSIVPRKLVRWRV